MTSVMRAFGLGQAEQDALKSGNAGKIKTELTGAEPLCFLIGLSIGFSGKSAWPFRRLLFSGDRDGLVGVAGWVFLRGRGR